MKEILIVIAIVAAGTIVAMVIERMGVKTLTSEISGVSF